MSAQQKINQLRDAGFSVSLFAEPESDSPLDSMDDAEEFIAGLNRDYGKYWPEWRWCVARVRIGIDGLYHESFLGCCSYSDAVDFIENSGYCADMIDDCLEAFRQSSIRISEALEKLKEVL